MNRHRRHIGFMMLIVGCLLFAEPEAWAQQPKYGGTLRVAWEADVTGPDPATSTGLQAFYIKGNLFNTLVTVDANLNFAPEPGRVVGRARSSVEAAREDVKGYVFLRGFKKRFETTWLNR